MKRIRAAKGAACFKRAVDAANTVNGLIEADIIDVFREWREKRQGNSRVAA